MQWYKYKTIVEEEGNKSEDPISQIHRVLAYYRAKGYSLNGLTTKGPTFESKIVTQLLAENVWYQDSRPFFRVWPLICEMSQNTKLDVKWESVLSVLQEIGIKSLCLVTRKFAFLASFHELYNEKGEVHSDAMSVYYCKQYHTNVRSSQTGLSILTPGDSLDLDNAVGDVAVSDSIREGVKLLVTCVLLHSNAEFVTPIVLDKDRVTYERTGDSKLVIKAKARGVFGWEVGKNVNVKPHFRRPHFAIRWTGKGREVPKLVPVKGCIVNKCTTEIPSGYLDKGDTP